MNRLLIVDDERRIVNSLVELFHEAKHIDLEVFWAYTAMEAMERLRDNKIDILLTDIQMPGMNGIELQQEVIRRWPNCKVIFLTGYNDYVYIQAALRNKSVDYLMKTDGNEAIIKAVENAVSIIMKEQELNVFISNAKRQMHISRPFLQEEFMLNVIHGDPYSLRNLKEQLEELQIPLNSDAGVLFVLGRVDNWHEEFSFSDRMRLLYAISNIAEEYLSPMVSCLAIKYDRSKLVWIIQPKAEENDYGTGVWKHTIKFVHGTFETIQSTCKKLLDLKVSFILGSEPVDWEKSPQKFEIMKSIYSSGFGIGTELILSEDGFLDETAKVTQEYQQKLQAHIKKVELLKTFLDNGHKDSFFKVFKEVINVTGIPNEKIEMSRKEIYFSLVSLFLSYINRWELAGGLTSKIELDRLTRFEDFLDWNEIVECFCSLAEILFKQKENDMAGKEDEIVNKINQYIIENLNGDLSLTRLGDVVHHNPKYLSFIYKKMSGNVLSDYIMEARLEKAKELLKNDQFKIHEISDSVGFISDAYFYRFFKKAMNMTPQEYRDSFKQGK